MLVNEVTRKSEQISRSIEGFWVFLILSGFFALMSWLGVAAGSWMNWLIAIPLTYIFAHCVMSLRWLYRFRRQFEESPSAHVNTRIREPMFIHLFSSFYHK